VVSCLMQAGYFEGVTITQEDRERAQQYQGNIQRDVLRAASGGLGAYLQNLEMELQWYRFDRVGLQRIVQLINKTNQFNLTTRRTTENEVLALMRDPRAFGLQFRLLDRFGDNGIIGIVSGRMEPGSDDMVINTWLMSCRVLGRGVEQAMIGVVADCAAKLGARRLIGEYRPTRKNGMVRDHYARLGFRVIDIEADGSTRNALALADYTPPETLILLTHPTQRIDGCSDG
jgi:FkbH-like protein